MKRFICLLLIAFTVFLSAVPEGSTQGWWNPGQFASSGFFKAPNVLAGYAQYGTLALDLNPEAAASYDGSFLVDRLPNQATTGSNYDFVQATGANKPNFDPDSFNGKDSIDFDGSTDRLDIEAAGRDLLKNLPGATLFVVWQSDLTTTGQNVFFARDAQAGGFSGTLALQRNTNCQDVAAAERVSNVGSTSITADSYMGVYPQLNTVVADYANTDLYLYRNGNLVASNTSFETAGSTSNSNAVGISIGYYPQSNNAYLKGKLYRLLLYQNTLSPTNRAAVEAALTAEYGLAPQQLLVFDGDSQTAGLGVSVSQSYPAQLITALNDNYYWQNVGVSGHQIWQRKDAAEAAGGIFTRTYHADEPKPWLSFMGGGNDMEALIGGGTPVATAIATAYTRLLAYVTSANASNKFDRIAVSTQIPAVDTATTDALRPFNDDYIIPGATGDLAAAGATHFPRPDLLNHFNTNTSMTDTGYYQVDARHPNAAGMTILQAAFNEGFGLGMSRLANSVAPVLSVVGGNPLRTGETVSATQGTWTGFPTPTSYAYQHKNNTVDIGGATNQTFVITDTQISGSLTAAVTASNDYWTAGPTTSNALSPVLPAFTSRIDFNDGSGTTAVDAKGIANATFSGTPTWGSGYASQSGSNSTGWQQATNSAIYTRQPFTLIMWGQLNSMPGVTTDFIAEGLCNSTAAANQSFYATINPGTGDNTFTFVDENSGTSTLTVNIASIVTAQKLMGALTYDPWGGTAAAGAGTVSVTSGSATVTGSGSSFTAGMVGRKIVTNGGQTRTITSYTSATVVGVDSNFSSDETGVAYTLSRASIKYRFYNNGSLLAQNSTATGGMIRQNSSFKLCDRRNSGGAGLNIKNYQMGYKAGYVMTNAEIDAVYAAGSEATSY